MGRAKTVGLVLALLTYGWGAAVAQDANLGPDAPPGAEKRYLIGKELYLAGRFAEAAAEFSVAFEMMPTSARLAYNLARSQERAGDLVAAVAAFERYLELSPRAEDHAEVAATVAVLRRRIEASLPELVITSAPPGARVAVDDDAPLEQPTPVTVRVAPGQHVLRFELAGYGGVTQPVRVLAGQSNSAHAAMVRVEAEPVVAVAEPAPAEAEPAPPEWRPIAGWTAVGLGAAGLVVGGVFAAQASSTVDEMNGLMARDWRRFDALDADLSTQRTVAWVGIGVGAAIAAAGTALLLWPDGDAGTAPEAALAPTGPGAVGVIRW